MPAQTKKATDEWEEKDCKSVNMDLTFLSHDICNPQINQVDVTIANVVQNNGESPFTLEVVPGGMPQGMRLELEGSAVKLRGLYLEPIAGSLGTAYFRVNDANGCCVCGSMNWTDQINGVCPSPFKEGSFGGSEITCTDTNFDNLPE